MPRLAAAVAAVALLAITPMAHAGVSFAPAQPYETPSPTGVALGDLNGDAKLDVVTASFFDNTVRARLGNGDGTLGDRHDTAAAPNPLLGVAVGDVNGDGLDDAVAAEAGGGDRVRIYISNGDGTFADPPTLVPVGDDPQDVAIGWVNTSDSAMDIATANQQSHNVTVLLNSGTGTFAPASGSPVAAPGGGNPQGVAIADVVGNEGGDIVFAVLAGASPGAAVAAGDGMGGFAAAAPLGGSGVQKPAIADFTHDGLNDIVATRPAIGDVAVYVRGAGDAFGAPQLYDPDGAGGTNSTLATADFDGDGSGDLAVANLAGGQANHVSIGTGAGDGTFTSASQEAVGNFPRQVAAGDLDRDGNDDFVTANSGTNDVSVVLANRPAVTVTPSLAFGSRRVLTTGAEKKITVTGGGPARVSTGTVTRGGAHPGDFSIATNTCDSAHLAAGETCSVGVKFTPMAAGARSATVSIPSNATGSPHVVTVTGTGVRAPRLGPCTNRRTGTPSADTLNGTAFGDRLIGLAGNDKLSGRAGADCLSGGKGNDRLDGGRDTDRLSGGYGRDRMDAGSGKNVYRGGKGNDTVQARNGARDRIDCGPGRRDVAFADMLDKVKRCEVVRRR